VNDASRTETEATVTVLEACLDPEVPLEIRVTVKLPACMKA
jgi:hypothetical protein